jgi:hypothetical protein
MSHIARPIRTSAALETQMNHVGVLKVRCLLPCHDPPLYGGLLASKPETRTEKIINPGRADVATATKHHKIKLTNVAKREGAIQRGNHGAVSKTASVAVCATVHQHRVTQQASSPRRSASMGTALRLSRARARKAAARASISIGCNCCHCAAIT